MSHPTRPSRRRPPGTIFESIFDPVFDRRSSLGGPLGLLRDPWGSWGRLGIFFRVLGSSWESLGAPWGSLGSPWGLLGAPWDLLGAPWKLLGGSFGAPVSSWGCVGCVRALLGALWRPPCDALDTSRWLVDLTREKRASRESQRTGFLEWHLNRAFSQEKLSPNKNTETGYSKRHLHRLQFHFASKTCI